MDIKQLKYFIEVADTQNLSRAAENLHISQPTLSLSMKKIEKDLNVKLFDTKVKYGLSEPGEILYNKGKNIVNDFDHLISEVENYDLDLSENFKLGVTILFAVQFMHQISSFIAKHPSINLHIIQNGSVSLQKKLVKREIDAGIVSYPNLFPDEIDLQPISTGYTGYNVSVVMQDDHPLASAESLDLEELRDEEFSSFDDNFMIGGLLKERSKQIGFKPNIVFMHDDLHELLNSITKLNSVCLLPIEYRELVDMPHLKWIPLEDEHAYFKVGLARNRHRADSQIIDDFINEII